MLAPFGGYPFPKLSLSYFFKMFDFQGGMPSELYWAIEKPIFLLNTNIAIVIDVHEGT